MKTTITTHYTINSPSICGRSSIQNQVAIFGAFPKRHLCGKDDIVQSKMSVSGNQGRITHFKPLSIPPENSTSSSEERLRSFQQETPLR